MMNNSKQHIQVLSLFETLQFLTILVFALVSFVTNYLLQVDLSLETIDNGIYAEATYHGVDIAARKNLIWKLLLYCTLISTASYCILKYLRHFDLAKKALYLFSILSFAGLLAFWVKLIGVNLPQVQKLVHLSFLLATIYLLTSQSLSKLSKEFKFSFFEHLLAFISITVFSHLVLPTGLGFEHRVLSLGTAGYLIFYLSIRLFPNAQKHSNKFLGVVLFLPFAYFIFLEYLVNNKSAATTYGSLKWICLAVLFFSVFLYFDKPKSYFKSKMFLGSIFVMALTILAYYAYAIEYPVDQFEIANQANAMMRYFKFQEWPFIHYLSSHNLYDHLWPFLYTFINGYQDNVSYLSYDFSRHVITTVIGFILISYLFRNWAVAALFVCLYPLNRALFPMSMAILMIIPWIKTFEQLEAKKIILILSLSVALVFWRMDVGFGNLLACFALLLVYLFQFGAKETIAKIIKPAIIFIVLGVVILILTGLIFDFNTLRNHLSQALGYFSADQAHGLSNLTLDKGGRLFYIHYLAFPISIFAIAVFLILRFKKIYATNPRILISLLYLIFYYFANFQRGLVRHSFMSGTDAFLSSFVFLIFALSITLLIKKNWQLIAFLITATFFIHNFRLAGAGGMHSIYEKVIINLNTNPPKQICNTTFLEGRMVDVNKPYRGIEKFMNENFSDEDTFLDFTNAPMLYFYTQRHVPSYFNQYLQNTVTRKLQDQNIIDLKSKKVPVVIFQSHPLNWGDATDKVPNALRYMHTATYIYENYQPYQIIDGKEIWLENKNPLLDIRNIDLQHDSVSYYDLKKLPSIMEGEEMRRIDRSLTINQSGLFEIPYDNYSPWSNYLTLDFVSIPEEKEIKVDLLFPDNSIITLNFQTTNKPGQIYSLPVSWLYKYNQNIDNLSKLLVKVNSQAKVSSLSITQYIGK